MTCKMSENLGFKETGPSQDQNFVWSDNPSKDIWNKINKSFKTQQDRKSLISTFASFLTAIAKV